ncbi:MAG: PD-(D/E)XK nuclease family protein [Cruoricaptor ignavus]|nr:PD-(D/E)XK nuclease family protein [Cruoricaptor ignavus]
MEKINQLLNQIKEVRNKYQDTEENFNLFSILRIESSELKHSMFLAELLNPKGCHGQGTIFLEKFIEFFELEDFDFKDSYVEIEKYIGKKIYNGGRLDIVITNRAKNQIILIENKIYADEQPDQMKRYSNCTKNYENSKVFFLTLDGRESNTKNCEDEVIKISYALHILTWLELCMKETKHSALNEAIQQYINTIKKLTNQTINDKMAKEIQNIIQNNFEESREIYNNFQKAIFPIYTKVLEKLKNKIENELITNHPTWKIKSNSKTEILGKERGRIFIYDENIGQEKGFGIESFNSLYEECVFIGKYDEKNKDTWIYRVDMEDYKNINAKASNPELIKLLLADDTEIDEFVNHLYFNFKAYFDENKDKT